MSSEFKRRTFRVRQTTEHDKNDMLEFLQKYYMPQTPSASYFNLATKDNPLCKEMENALIKNIDNPSLNLVAVDDEKIVGACLNKEVTKSNYLNKADAVDENYANYIKFWVDMKTECDLFGRFSGIDKALVIATLAVNDEYRGLGIGLQLVSKTRELAKELGYELLTANCSSFYSAQIFKKLGFEVILRKKYDTYKINENEAIKPIPPHDYVEIFALRI